MISLNRRQILISGVFLWLFAVAGTALVALTEYSTSTAIAENERQLLLRNLYALLPRDRLDNDIAADTLEIPASPLLGTDSVTPAWRARRNGEPVAVVFNSIAPNGYSGRIHLLIGIYIDGSLAGVRVVKGIEDCALTEAARVLIVGAGPIGLMFAALAKNLGCLVIVAGRGERRIQAAESLGASKVIDVTGAKDLATVILKDCDPFDVVIEAVGKPETWQASLQLVRKGGTVNFFGGCPSGTSISLDTALMHYSDLRLIASFHHTPRTIRRALEFIENGVIRADTFVDGEHALADLPDLFRSMTAGNKVVKTLIRTQDQPVAMGLDSAD